MKFFVRIITESVSQAWLSLKANKLRSFLSLLGITIGIFCIIAVFSAVASLQNSIKAGFGELGSDVIIVDVMPWAEDPGDNYWKYVKRPSPSFRDFELLQDKLKLAENVAYCIFTGGKTIKYASSSVEGIFLMGTTFEYPEVQAVDIEKGRYFTQSEYNLGANKVLLGAKIANELFGPIEALGKEVKLFGQKFQVIGVLKDEGENPFNMISYDEAVWVSFNTIKRFVNTKSRHRFEAAKLLYAKKTPEANLEDLKEEMIGTLRSIRRLKPKEDDNFSLNELSQLNNMVDNVFAALYIAGFLIGIFALIVGMVSVANIMFVSVKERTRIIGIKKAIGAKNGAILLEFLIESIVLCLIGGLFGLIMVVLVLKLVSTMIPFEIAPTTFFMIFGIVISVIVGIVAGIIPAIQASRMDPVEAMRK